MNSRGWSIFSRAWLVLLILVLGLLPTLGFASPPDPTWIPGIYDDADYDDVVVLVTSSSGDVSPVGVADLPPILRGLGSIASRPDSYVPDFSPSVVLPRGPPSS